MIAGFFSSHQIKKAHHLNYLNHQAIEIKSLQLSCLLNLNFKFLFLSQILILQSLGQQAGFQLESFRTLK